MLQLLYTAVTQVINAGGITQLVNAMQAVS